MMRRSLDVQNRILQGLNHILRIRQTQTKWRLNSEHVSKGTALTEQQPSLPGQLHQLVGLVFGGLLGLLVLDQLEADHQALAADVADDPVLLLQVAQLSQQIVSHCFGIFVQFFPSDSVEHFESDPALDMSSSEGIEKDVFDLVGDFLASDHSADRETVSDALGHGDDVRLDSLPSVAPILCSHPAEACLNLVADNQTAVFVTDQIHHLGEVSLREGIDAADALDALEDES